MTSQNPIPVPQGARRPRSRIAAKVLGILHILYSLEVGIALLWLPWMGVWENNLVLYLYPQIAPVVTNPFFKGAVLGLGIDNILIGIYDVIHIKSSSEGYFS